MEVKTQIKLAILELGTETQAIQTLIALKAVLKAFPHVEIDAVVSAEAYDYFAASPFIGNVYKFDSSKLTSKIEMVCTLEGALEKPYTVVFNCSDTAISSHVSVLIPGTLKLGYGRKLDGNIALLDAWTGYQHALKSIDAGVPIHRIDVLATQLLTCLQLHFCDPAEGSDTPVSSKGFFVTKPDGPMDLPHWHTQSRKWIAFELDEHSFSSTLDEAAVAKSCVALLKANSELSIIILGKTPSGLYENLFMTEMDREILDEGIEFKRRAKDSIFYFSKHFTFQRRVRILQRLSLLISSSEKSLALASALGVRSVYVTDTSKDLSSYGAYGNGHYVSYAKTPETLAAHLLYLQQEWRHRGQLHFDEFFEATQPEFIKQAQLKPLLKSRILGSKDGGGVIYENAGQVPYQNLSWVSSFHAMMARELLCGWMPDLSVLLARIPPYEVRPQELRDCLETTQVLNQILASGLTISKQLHRTCTSLKSENLMTLDDIQNVQSHGRELKKIEDLLHRAAQTRPELGIFSSYYKVFFNELDGHRLSSLALGSIEIFETLLRLTALFQTYIESLLDHKRATLVPQRAKILRLERSLKADKSV